MLPKNLNEHIRTIHNKIDRKYIPCTHSSCKETFSNLSNMRRHFKHLAKSSHSHVCNTSLYILSGFLGLSYTQYIWGHSKMTSPGGGGRGSVKVVTNGGDKTLYSSLSLKCWHAPQNSSSWSLLSPFLSFTKCF